MKHKNLSDVFGANPWGIKSKILEINHDFTNIIGIDAGGTKTLIAHVDHSIVNRSVKRLNSITCSGKIFYEGDKYSSLNEIIASYLNEYNIDSKETLVCIAGAGPVQNNSIKMSNRSWSIHSDEIENTFQFKKVYLINDLEAMIYSIDSVQPDHLTTLNHGKKIQHGNIAVIAAGTGLGESIGVYVTQKNSIHAVSTEGGGCDFAPSNDFEIGLMKYLMQLKNHVSWEDVLSGNGLINIFKYLVASGSEITPDTQKDMEILNPAEVIAAKGLSNQDAVCRKALETFVLIYAREAANLALKCLPCGGLYIAGGIAPKLSSLIQDKSFINQFFEKGKLKPVLESIPVYLITNPDYGVIGAINYALLNSPF
ncbi:MAG: glucokinase [Spirochaetia bacterium]|nr:glucokinase [Spirochaetia bacterium]